MDNSFWIKLTPPVYSREDELLTPFIKNITLYLDQFIFRKMLHHITFTFIQLMLSLWYYKIRFQSLLETIIPFLMLALLRRTSFLTTIYGLYFSHYYSLCLVKKCRELDKGQNSILCGGAACWSNSCLYNFTCQNLFREKKTIKGYHCGGPHLTLGDPPSYS